MKISHETESKEKNTKIKNNRPRKPRKDKGLSKSSIAAELSGIPVDDNQSKEIVCNSGKVALSSSALRKEVEDLSEYSSHETDVSKIEIETDAEGDQEYKNNIFITDLHFPIKQRIHHSEESDECQEPVENSNILPEKKYDFSQFLGK